jgi:hypothetical protein
MIIRQYGDLPTTYAPDIGEVVLARRVPAEPFLRAVVIHVKRRRDGALRIKVQWLDSLEDAGVWKESPIVAGGIGWVVQATTPDVPRLIKQIPRGTRAQP